MKKKRFNKQQQRLNKLDRDVVNVTTTTTTTDNPTNIMEEEETVQQIIPPPPPYPPPPLSTTTSSSSFSSSSSLDPPPPTTTTTTTTTSSSSGRGGGDPLPSVEEYKTSLLTTATTTISGASSFDDTIPLHNHNHPDSPNNNNNNKQEPPEDISSSSSWIIHDQLPNVEEYKASIGYRNSSSTHNNNNNNNNKTKRRKDPEAFYYDEEKDGLIMFEQGGTIHDNNNNHDNNNDEDDEWAPVILPMGSSSKSPMQLLQEDRKHRLRFWKWCALSSLLLIGGIVILFAETATTNQEVQDFYHFVKGNTETYQHVVEYVSITRGLSHIDTFRNKTSPQYMAAQWMAHGDPMKLQVPTTQLLDEKESYTYDERYTMVVVYFSLGGPEWTYPLKFLTGDHVCTWYSELKLSDQAAIPYIINNNVWNNKDEDAMIVLGSHGCKPGQHGELVSRNLILPSNNLKGTIPHEIRFLENLEYLNLEFNKGITGTLPPALQDMTYLKQLMLQWCTIGGTIPSWIGKLTNLNYLGLGHNELTGTIPQDLQQLTRLQLLGMDDNQLYGNIDTFGTLENIQNLYLEGNHFSGTISDDLLQGWPKLQELDVSDNLLTGSLPPNCFNHHPTTLQVIDFHGNQFNGPLPQDIAESNLEFLALYENVLTGIVPSSLYKMTKLRHLDVSDNKLIGNLPNEMGFMTNLEYLFTGNNNLMIETLPAFFLELSNLRELSMKRNHLTGSIPLSITYLTNLIFLDFHDNDLTGSLPNEIGSLTDLRHLILKKNKLSGTLPSSLSSLKNLEVVLLEQNEFTGTAQVLCERKTIQVDVFVTDCGSGGNGNGGNGNKGSISCECCSECCDVGDYNCNEFEWKGNLDPIWEYGYRRQRYSYNLGPDVWLP